MQFVVIRVQRYRLLAQELRTASKSMKTPTGQATYTTLAENYDHLADWLENKPRSQTERLSHDEHL
jgi:hypothetical protein